MPGRKRNKSHGTSQIESLQLALRNTGNKEHMEQRLATIKLEEEREKQRIMQSNAAHASQSNVSINGKEKEGSTKKQNGGGGGNRMRHRSGSVAELEDRLQVVLWRRPFQTISYFCKEVPCSLDDAWNRFVFSLCDSKRKAIPFHRKILILAAVLVGLYSMYSVFGRNDPESQKIRERVYWYGYWVFLGILSSVGLGTGLHTFVLYLGPFIAKVALAAQDCDTVDFPTPPYPETIVCPEGPLAGVTVSMFQIMGKVRWEALMWGFGTALGELPPFFMARAARVSGMVDDDDLAKFAELLQRKKRADPKSLTFVERGKLFMEDLVERVGFWGILACASIPNPLFDMAGITCGHFLVPFSTFFGATVIGKAVIKAHLQMMFVILAFNQGVLDSVVSLIQKIPQLGPSISDPFIEFMQDQKASIHRKANSSHEPGHLSWILDKIVICVVIYFVISIINSMAQSYHKRVSKEKAKQRS